MDFFAISKKWISLFSSNARNSVHSNAYCSNRILNFILKVYANWEAKNGRHIIRQAKFTFSVAGVVCLVDGRRSEEK